jgi:DNA-binding CsgD family transcriptional regulator
VISVQLTQKQLRSLLAIAEGMTLVEIAAAEQVSKRAIVYRLENACNNLGALSNANAVWLAVNYGQLRLGEIFKGEPNGTTGQSDGTKRRRSHKGVP